MSLLRLLTVGRSLTGIRQSGRYQMVQDTFLPKFVSTEEHRRGSGNRLSNAADAPNTAVPEAQVWPFKARSNSPDLKPFMPSSETAAPRPVPQAMAPAVQSSKAPRNRWAILRSLFSRRSAGRSARLFVQGELSLGTVKVMRNDLNDWDVELVRTDAKPPTTPIVRSEPKKYSQTDEALAASGMEWNELTAKLFEVSRSRLL
jgi:hypothetical protein